LHTCRLGNLDEESRAQFLWRRQEFIVHVQLILHLGRLENAFGADHFLHLEPQRLAVLEHQRHERAERHPSSLLQCDDAGTIRLALSFILIKRQNIVAGQDVHFGNPYASRTTWIGWSAAFPPTCADAPAWSSCKPARGQSVATRSAGCCRMARTAFSAI